MASDIEWTHPPGFLGATLEVTLGCTAISPGCANCYAAELVGRRLGRNPSAPRYHGLAVIDEHSNRAKWTGAVRTNPDVLSTPERTRAPTCYFVSSRSDLFHERVPTSYIVGVFERMRATAKRGILGRHRFVVLTKRSARLAELAEVLDAPSLPASIAVGVSVEDQAHARRLDDLERFECPTRLVSLEPLLGPVRLGDRPWLSWGILGGESGPFARATEIADIVDTSGDLAAQGIPRFAKQLGRVPITGAGGPLSLRHKRGGDRSEWPDSLRAILDLSEYPRAWALGVGGGA